MNKSQRRKLRPKYQVLSLLSFMLEVIIVIVFFFCILMLLCLSMYIRYYWIYLHLFPTRSQSEGIQFSKWEAGNSLAPGVTRYLNVV